MARHVSICLPGGERLGLEINMNNDAGWDGSGGPWNTPELSMQRILWSEVAVEGGSQFDDELPHPKPQPSSSGAPAMDADYYRDIAVLAFPTPLNSAYRLGCLLYTSDAADEEDSVVLGGRRI